MSETRITGDMLRNPKFSARVWMASEEAAIPRHIVEALADQVDADTRRLADLEAENAALKEELSRLRSLERMGNWYWRFEDSPELLGHGTRHAPFATAHECWAWWAPFARERGRKGYPLREVRNADKDILLLREGRPIPTEGGPWT